jgi:hypothetical protein
LESINDGWIVVDNTSDANKPVSLATQTALDLKAFSFANIYRNVSGIDKTMVD